MAAVGRLRISLYAPIRTGKPRGAVAKRWGAGPMCRTRPSLSMSFEDQVPETVLGPAAAGAAAQRHRGRHVHSSASGRGANGHGRDIHRIHGHRSPAPVCGALRPHPLGARIRLPQRPVGTPRSPVATPAAGRVRSSRQGRARDIASRPPERAGCGRHLPRAGWQLSPLGDEPLPMPLSSAGERGTSCFSNVSSPGRGSSPR